MFKRFVATLLIVVSLSLSGCVSAASGFKSFIDSTDGYQLLYPNGWVPVKVTNGPDVVLHDIIHPDENVSVVISPIQDTAKKSLADLGSPGEIGYRLSKSAIAPEGSGREAELVNAESREVGDKTYYLLEYITKVNGQERRNLASVAVGRGKLYTVNASVTEERWEKMKDLLEGTVRSFTLD
jgi:photosystem II oxygen-evolving enhancer protein 2